MSRHVEIFADISGRIFRSGLLAASIGGALYGLIFEALLGLTKGGSVLDIVNVILDIPGAILFASASLCFGLGFGFLAAIADGCVMGGFMATGIFQPRIKSVHRWFLCGVSAIVTAACIGFEIEGLVGYFSDNQTALIGLPTLIAAIGGWWVAHRVLTYEPRKKKNDESIADSA